ncbi:hypothetical protein RB195_020833 [Necator americanus]|uniref:Uncharacterized protein n=1 Tax=Necator americanus TaxID=51031 RepID=A0ABR1CKR3_NECAM
MCKEAAGTDDFSEWVDPFASASAFISTRSIATPIGGGVLGERKSALPYSRWNQTVLTVPMTNEEAL